jgi:RNA polymerase sigma-70 factor (ECF subfamily)
VDSQLFDEQRPRLRAIAYRMLGSLTEADDAVQETWLRLSRTDTAEVENLGAWLTTVVARVCLNMLRTRDTRREEPLEVHLPDLVIGADPEHEALLADAVGVALLVVLETLTPAERLAFVLHDMFAVPFSEIGRLVERSPAAARQLASRARRRVQGQTTTPDPDLNRQRALVDAFFAATREGDFEALLGVLAPDVVLRSDGGAGKARTVTLRGAHDVAGQAVMFSRLAPFVRAALINGAAGVVVINNGRALSVMAFTVAAERIAAIDVLSDPQRLAELDLREFFEQERLGADAGGEHRE